MEPLEIYDAINNKHINVYVTTEVAQRCRTDNVFAQDLFNKLQEQTVEEGSAIEIETIKSEYVDESVADEEKFDKETWGRRDTLKLIRVYQMHKDKFKEYSQKRSVWCIIADQLAQRKVYKTPEKCAEKWKNLIRTYKHINDRPSVPTRFQFYQEMKNVFNDTEVVLSDTDSDDETEEKYKPSISYVDEGGEKESWSRYETLKMLKAYQKHKDLRLSFVKERQFWAVVSAELKKDNIHKRPEKCATKWKNLYRSYKKNVDKPALPIRFQYFQEVNYVLNDIELVIPDNIVNISEDADFEKIMDPEQFKCFLEKSVYDVKPRDNGVPWTPDETIKLIKVYKKHKHRFSECPTKKYVWGIVATELAKEGVHRNAEKCENRWKTLMRSYKKDIESGAFPKFYFYEEMADILNDGTSNDGEVSTTQNDASVTYDHEEFDSMDNTDALEKDGDDGENVTYEEIIIETEPDQPSDSDDNKYWSYNETSTFLKAYADHRNKFKDSKNKKQMWEAISQDLHAQNVFKTPENCEKKWRGLYSVYKTHKLNKSGPGKFGFYREIDNILKESNNVDADNSENVENTVEPDKRCKCSEKRMLDKQQRHIERMRLLKRKLDLEERKVEAFEYYVKHLKRKSS